MIPCWKVFIRLDFIGTRMPKYNFKKLTKSLLLPKKIQIYNRLQKPVTNGIFAMELWKQIQTLSSIFSLNRNMFLINCHCLNANSYEGRMVRSYESDLRDFVTMDST